MIDQVPGLLISPYQERWMFMTARSLQDGANIVEIGSFKGRSTCCFAYGCTESNKHVYSIDTFNGNDVDFHHRDFFDEFRVHVERCGLWDYVTPCPGFSYDVVKIWDRPIHLLFIDGSHEYEDVLADFEGFYPHVVPGGIVAFHDYDNTCPGVQKAFDGHIREQLTEVDLCRTIIFGRKPV